MLYTTTCCLASEQHLVKTYKESNQYQLLPEDPIANTGVEAIRKAI